jgi:hypothetical protein
MTNTTDLHSPLLPSDAEFERMKSHLFDRIEADAASLPVRPVTAHTPGRTTAKRRSRRR